MPRRLFLAAAVLLAAGLAAARENPSVSGAPDRGHRLFDIHCARCHGIGGGGGEGPPLARPVLRRAPDEAALVGLIQNGIPRTAMTGSFALSDDEARRVAAYVRWLGRVAQEPVAGDAARGSTIYEEQACGACHIVRGEGRGIGPELTTIGIARGIDHLRESLLDAGAVVAEEYRVVALRTAAGAAVRGVRVNQDDFSIQVRDADARLHSLMLADLISLRLVVGESLMPSYSDRLSGEEIQDLVAYLAGLRGEP